jgi:hypothetical protein
MTSRHTIDRYVKERFLDGCLHCNNAKQRRWMVSANIALQQAINDHSK